jgi:hypothetical protein
MANDSDKLSQFHEVYDINQTAWHEFQEQACLDLDYYLKAQHSEEEADAADRQDRTLHTIDKIGRQVNLLHGYEIRNRHILKIGQQGAFEEKEDEACNQHTGVTMSLMSRHGGYDALSEAFKWGTLVEGSNLLEMWRDRDGLIQYGRLGWNQFLLDHGLTKPDLSDCGDILTGQWISTDKAKMLVPTRAEQIDDIQPLTVTSRWEFQGMPAMQNKAKKRLFEQWWHRTTEEISVVQNRFTGNKITFKEFVATIAKGDVKLARQIIDEFKTPDGTPQLTKFREIKDKVELTIVLDDELLWEGNNPTQLRDFNYIWVHGLWCPEQPRTELKLQSFVRGLRDPQRAYNRRINQIYDIIESQIQNLRIIKPQFIQNPEDAYRSGQGVVLHVNEAGKDTPLSEVFLQATGSEVPQSLFTALEVTDRAETETGGLSPEMLGTDDKEISGVLHAYRTGQALTGQAWMFQDFRASKRDMGRKQVQIVQLNYNPERIQKILNQPPVEGFYEEDLTRFDCTPTEGLLTESQQNMYYQEIKELLERFPDMFRGIFTPEMLIKASPMQFKNATLKAIQQGQQQIQQAQQKAQQQEQLDQQLLSAVTATQIAKTQEDIADAQESRSQAGLNAAKTITEINKNRAAIEQGGIDSLIRLVEVLQSGQATPTQTQ